MTKVERGCHGTVRIHVIRPGDGSTRPKQVANGSLLVDICPSAILLEDLDPIDEPVVSNTRAERREEGGIERVGRCMVRKVGSDGLVIAAFTRRSRPNPELLVACPPVAPCRPIGQPLPRPPRREQRRAHIGRLWIDVAQILIALVFLAEDVYAHVDIADGQVERVETGLMSGEACIQIIEVRDVLLPYT